MSKLGANLYDDMKREVIEWYFESFGLLQGDLTVDGRPPFTDERPPREQYELLSFWRATNDPRFTGDPTAQDALVRLEKMFGPAVAPVGVA